jgi:hypothetical protein
MRHVVRGHSFDASHAILHSDKPLAVQHYVSASWLATNGSTIHSDPSSGMFPGKHSTTSKAAPKPSSSNSHTVTYSLDDTCTASESRRQTNARRVFTLLKAISTSSVAPDGPFGAPASSQLSQKHSESTTSNRISPFSKASVALLHHPFNSILND